MEDSYLGPDMFHEILSRVTLKTLDGCKPVCKGFNDLAYDSSFSRLHTERTGIVTGYFFYGRDGRTKFVSADGPRLDKNFKLNYFPCRSVKVLACSNQGIMVCSSTTSSRTDRQFFVCKPCMERWKALPNPKLRYNTLRVAIVVLNSKPLRFKILRLSRPKELSKSGYFNERCEIFDSDKWEWKELEEISLARKSMWWDFDHAPATVSSGTAYWIYDNKLILGYNLESENYETLEFPQEVKSIEREYMKLTTFKGAFSLVCEHQDRPMTLWVLRNQKEKIWERKETLRFESTSKLMQSAKFAGFYSSNIALMTADSSLIFYNIGDNSFSEVPMEESVCEAEIFPFRSDMEQVSFKRSSIN